MSRSHFVYCMALLIILWESTDGLSVSEHRNYVRLFGRAARRKREISDTIQNCQHWKIAHSDDPEVTDVIVKLHNSASKEKKMSSALQCHTMNKLEEPKLNYKVAAGGTKEIIFSIAVSPAHYHHDSSVRTHQCLLSTWSEDPNSYITCKITMSVWPNGLFFYNCSSYQTGQLSVHDYTSHLGTKVRLQNTGPKSLYLVNSSCTPTIMTLTHTNKYKRLLHREDWTLDFPASCDGRIGINYKGQCHVEIFHVCLRTTTLIKKITFDFIDGEIEECEHRKSKFSLRQRHWLVSLVGLNSISTSAMLSIAVLLAISILSTLTIKFILSVQKYGSVYKAKREFQLRFQALFPNPSKDSGASDVNTLEEANSKP